MENEELEINDIVAKCCGYSMIYYEFYRIERVTDSSFFLQQFESKYHPDTEDCFRPLVIPDLDHPIGKLIRKSKKSYIGGKWSGKPLQEDHLD